MLVALAAAAPALVAAAVGTGGPGAADAPSAGERAYLKCYSCHAIEGEERLEGPGLGGIVGAPVADKAGFEYSPAMERFAKTNPVWTRALLDRFIADPEALVPGTSMAFAGIRDPAERAALIAYLRTSGERG